ncbi:MAG: tRNA (adenosine(37)-N6)-threonylcarbamoyltransferase complex transferase subunit TsaD [Clostridiales bacterium]|nr:tRNA (adenosine(37)-N6)-threonylcarbamoyltransferase complex transferase subunit TsaD [Clostridiales bacterium]
MSYFDKIKNAPIKDEPIIMGIETSCDETAVAIIKNGREILADEIISSATEHARFGGVVPEIASRGHTTAILTATENALKHANLTLEDIDAFAVTEGAGLLGALLVGVSFAKSLAFSTGKPLVPVSHIRGHIAASYLADKTLEPPFITILASGGHTAIIAVEDYYNLKVLGSTLDDAVGEAFDKVARVLGLNYPGGPNVERLAKDGENNIKLPKMLKNYDGGEYDFSYSGLKTAVINYVHNTESRGETINRADVANSFQHAAVDVLVSKAVNAAKQFGYKTIAVSGGVGANGYLREFLLDAAKKHGIKVVLPEKRYCTDNGAMIGAEGYLQYKKRNFADLSLNAKAVVSLQG